MSLTAIVITDSVNASPALIDYYRTHGLDVIESIDLLSN